MINLSCLNQKIKSYAFKPKQITTPSSVIDNVSGFTYSEIQSVYYLEPGTMAEFKNAVKAIRPSQAAAIDQLFASYGY